MQYKAIPTMFNGVLYRSKSEARLAVCFDAWGWDYTYEPEIRSVPGFKPDFRIYHESGTIRIIEYKPCRPTAKYTVELQRKFNRLSKNNADKKMYCELWCIDFYNHKSERLRIHRESGRFYPMDFTKFPHSFSHGSDFRFDLCETSDASVNLTNIIDTKKIDQEIRRLWEAN